MRMVQALLQVLSSYSLPFSLLLSLVSLTRPPTAPAPDSALMLSVLHGVRSRVALGRRFFRVFRFLESFQAAYNLYYPPVPVPSKGGGRGAEVWLDILGRSFNGMYLLLETLGLPDALAVPGLSAWGPDLAPVVHVEAQRFWFLALVCGVGAGLVRLVKLFAYAPVPETGEGFGDGQKPEKEGGRGEGEVSEQEGGDGLDAWKRDRDRMRRNLQAHRERRRKRVRHIRTASRKILRRLAADVLDLAVPGAVVGWVPVQPGTVGALMVVTTYLTGLDVWERCGREVAETKIAASPAKSG